MSTADAAIVVAPDPVASDAGVPTTSAARTLRIGSRRYGLAGPSIRDARLHTAAVLITVQVLGQTVLHFELSIAQILLSIGTCAFIEVVVQARRTGIVAWPASAMLTGNGIALILRVPGTVPGDWWSLRGAWIYVGVAAVSMASKYLLRVDGRHLFNPSNFGLVLVFLALGPTRVEPLDFWWVPMGPALIAAYAVIGIGGVLILRRLRLLPLAAVFWGVFAAGLAIVAVAGHCITARWHVGPLCGREFWWFVATSPEVMIFLFFMITDPRTVPLGRTARLWFAGAVAFTAVALMAPQTTEYASKVALLASLTLVCAARPWLERRFPATAHRAPATVDRRLARAALSATAVVAGAAVLVAASAPTRPVRASERIAAVDLAPWAADAVPPASVSDDNLSRQISAADAEQISQHLVEDLAVQADALIARDLDLARATADRAWLVRLEAAMSDATRERTIDVDRYRIDRIVVSVARRTGQAAPAVMATPYGTVRTETYRDGRNAPVASSAWRPITQSFEVLWAGTRFLVVSDELPEGFVDPRS